MSEVFADGNMADVVRIGNVIHKECGPWWSASKQVLMHLERVGYRWSPRVLGENDETTQLTFVPGSTIDASMAGYECVDVLVTIGNRVRELHDALAGFALEPGTETVTWPHLPAGSSLLCHNDISPWNTVMENQQFSGLIDWDLVSYGTPEWELAWVCWRFAPLYPTGDRVHFSAQEQAERCATLIRAYGVDRLDLRIFLDVMDARMACAVDAVELLGSQGVPGFDRLLHTGMHLSGIDDRRWMHENRPVLEAVLQSL